MISVRVHVRTAFLAFLFIGAPTAYASSENAKAFAIAKKNACLGCHAINK